MSESLGLDVVTEKARICGLATLLAELLTERAAVRKTNGANMLAMMGGLMVNCRENGNNSLVSPLKSRCRQTVWESCRKDRLLA